MVKNPSSSRFLRCNAGGIAVGAAIAAPLLMLLGGGALDVHHADQQRARMQDALDAAVIAGLAADPDGDEAAAQGTFAANKAADVPAARFVAGAGGMQGEVSTTVPTSFLRIVGVNSLRVTAQARAKVGDRKPPCVLVTEPVQTGLFVNSGSELDADGCAVHVRSTNKEAVSVNSGSKVWSQELCVKGGTGKKSGSKIEAPPLANCPAVDDPLKSVAEPVVAGSCPDREIDGAQSLAAGCYGKITVKNSARLTMGPGTYKLTGEFLIENGAKVQAPGVTLYLASVDAKLMVNSGGGISLSAPTSGPMQGFAVFQTRTAADANPAGIYFNSGAHGLLEGVVYAIHSDMVLNSNASGAAAYTLLITRSLHLNSGSKIKINHDYKTGPRLPRVLQPVYLEA